MDLMGNIMSMVGDKAMNHLTSSLAADPSQIKSATNIAVPMLLKAIANNSKTELGAKSLADALDKDHKGEILGSVESVVGSENNLRTGFGILKHVLGSKLGSITNMIESVSGLSSNKSEHLLAQLAPIVMGFLGKQKKDSGMNISSLVGMLSSVSKEVDEKGPGELNSFIELLDADGDGDIKDDLLKAGGSLLKKLF